jgi:hypothetical protein
VDHRHGGGTGVTIRPGVGEVGRVIRSRGSRTVKSLDFIEDGD